MGLKEEVTDDVAGIISQTWSIRDGTVVPTTKDVLLAGGGVKLDATVLYADLADSTELVMNQDARVAAKVMKCFLAACSRIIRAFDGEIRSFDGDRVMGIYVGDSKNSNAAKTALKIKWAFDNIVKPKLEAQYPSLTEGVYKLGYGAGIDTSSVLAVRGGVRGGNDLVWVGRAPNAAAKLSTVREDPYRTYITGDVYGRLDKASKYSTKDGKAVDMWEERQWSQLPGIKLYRSNYHWTL